MLVNKITAPLKSEIILKDTTKAYLSETIPGVKRISGTKICFEANNWDEFYDYLMTIIHLTRVSASFG